MAIDIPADLEVIREFNPTGPAARAMLEELGVLPEVIDKIFAEFDRLLEGPHGD